MKRVSKQILTIYRWMKVAGMTPRKLSQITVALAVLCTVAAFANEASTIPLDGPSAPPFFIPQDQLFDESGVGFFAADAHLSRQNVPHAAYPIALDLCRKYGGVNKAVVNFEVARAVREGLGGLTKFLMLVNGEIHFVQRPNAKAIPLFGGAVQPYEFTKVQCALPTPSAAQ